MSGTGPTVKRPATMGMGLVICQPMHIAGTGGFIVPRLAPQELRSWLLFWDRLAWPRSRYTSVSTEDDRDEEILTAAGILTRPTVELERVSGYMMQLMAREHIQAFLDLEKQEPGAWALAQGASSFLYESGEFLESRGALVELHRAIPVPNGNVPLDDILEFKAKRTDELSALRD